MCDEWGWLSDHSGWGGAATGGLLPKKMKLGRDLPDRKLPYDKQEGKFFKG